MNYKLKHKLKHLSKYCCNPLNELEFEAVKMAAELEKIPYMRAFDSHKYVYYSETYRRLQVAYCHLDCNYREEIPVLDFCNKLRMTEEEAEKLEDDRVEFVNDTNEQRWTWASDYMSLKAINGHYLKTNADGTEVTLHKKD